MNCHQLFAGLLALLLGVIGCEPSNPSEDSGDVSVDCGSGESCDGFEKPPPFDDYESPASKLSIENNRYKQISVEPRHFMRPDENSRKAWLYTDESAIIDASFLFDPSDVGEEFEEQEFVMYAFVDFRPVPFSVIRAQSGNQTEFASKQALLERPAKKVHDVEFNWDEINNYSVRIPPSSFGTKGIKVVHLFVVEANPRSVDTPYAAPGTLSWGLEVHFGSNQGWRGAHPTVRAPREKVRSMLLQPIFRTKSLMVPRPPVFDLAEVENESGLDLGQTFNAPSESIDITHYLTSLKASNIESSRIIVTYLKNRDEVVGGSPLKLNPDPKGPLNERLRFERTLDISHGDEPLRRLESVRFHIPDRERILGERSGFGNTLYFE